jgi:hypothetical protein
MTPLRQALDDYLAIRRQLGFKLEVDGRLLERFVAFVDQSGESRVTTELVLAWAKQPTGVNPHRFTQRLGIVVKDHGNSSPCGVAGERGSERVEGVAVAAHSVAVAGHGEDVGVVE